MNKYVVQIREVWVQDVEIEAENEQDALDLVQEGDGDHIQDNFEYSHTLDSDTWTVMPYTTNKES